MTSSRQPGLQPLRVPGGWTMSFNEFCAVDPSDDPEARAYLCEDLLQARCARTDVLIDLGWYPDGDPAGHYVLVAHRGDFRGEPLLRIEARTRAEAALAVEEAMHRFLVERRSTR